MHILRRAVYFLLPAACMIGGLAPARPSAAQPFSLNVVRHNLKAGAYGAHAYADLDRDGDFDVPLLGSTLRTTSFEPKSFVALSEEERSLNSGDSGYHRFQRNAAPTALWHGDVALADYDGDGSVDVLMSGAKKSDPPFAGYTVLYHNDGAGRLREASVELPDLYGSITAWGDYDNDGDSDLLLAGAESPQSHTTYLLRNDDGAFTVVRTPFADVAYGDAAWGDYDNDGDHDLLLTGARASGSFLTRLYRNDGGGSFREVATPLPNLAFGSVDWGDYDNDGDLDVLISGGRLTVNLLEGVTRVYTNTEDGFAQPRSLNGVVYGSARWGDYDVDGDLDALVAGGETAFGLRVGELYRFTPPRFERAAILPGAFSGASTWGDYDHDLDVDLLTSGLRNDGASFVKMYRNDQPTPNTPPSAPSGLQASTDGSAVTLSWTASTDAQTPAAGLSYNLRLGTAPGRGDVMAPLAAPDSGYRYVARLGNAGPNTSWTVRDLEPGTYYWSVQAVDNSFIGSAFAPEGSFQVQGGNKTGAKSDEQMPSRYLLHANYPNPFHRRTTIAYELPEPTHVTLTVYDVLGKKVRTLVDRRQPAARHRIVWNGRSGNGRRLSSGVYVVRMQTKQTTRTRQLTLVR